MKHLLNVLAGFGSSLNAFGDIPQYDVPRQGDQLHDFEMIGGDMSRVTARVENKAQKALTNGRANHRAG